MHIGHNINLPRDRSLEILRVTDPRHDKARIEEKTGGLLDTTCQWVLENAEFLNWRRDMQNKLLWIRGDPGKGKTMLLCSIINDLERTGGLVSYFFCQAADERINNAVAALRGLIYMLVQLQPTLISHVRKHCEHTSGQVFTDTNAWIIARNIFVDILRDPALKVSYLVIDAVDECLTGRTELLDLIVSEASDTKVKWIVSSRNWPDVEEKLVGAEQVTLSLELNSQSVSAAVELFIEEKTKNLAKLKGYDAKTTAQVAEYMASNAGDTFLWVAIVYRNLEKINRFKVLRTLHSFPAGLDQLYKRMMEQIREEGDQDDVDLCMQILSVASTVYRPITLDELGSFLECPCDIQQSSGWLEHYIKLCGSFLAIRSRSVFFVHQSAKDYLCQPANKLFPFGEHEMHYTIFSQCIRVMSGTLSRNLYGLSSPGYSLEDVKVPDPDPLGVMRYACIYWVDHLCTWGSTSTGIDKTDLQDGGILDVFLRKHYLHWLEALSLLQRMTKGLVSVSRLESLLQVMPSF